MDYILTSNGLMSSELYLAHHGVKGMHWGIRRYQDYGEGGYDPKHKGQFKGSKNEEYKSVSDKEALDYIKKHPKMKMDEEGKKKFKKYLAAAGITVAAAGALYLGAKVAPKYLDRYIKEGATMQTLSMHADRLNYGKEFYTAFNNKDKNRYNGLFARDREGTGAAIFGVGDYKTKITATAAKKMKIASPHNAEKVYNEMMKASPNIKDNLAKMGIKNHHDFNANIVNSNNMGDGFNGVKEVYYKMLEKKGYSGVIDVNDLKNMGAGLQANKPAIIFDRNKIGKVATQKLTEAERLKGLKTMKREEAVRGIVDLATNSQNVAYAVGAIGATGYAAGRKDTAKRKITEEKKKVDNYKKKTVK